jgi:RecA/RadA recombinase
MSAPFDFSKIRKDRNKRLGLRGGFSDPLTWIDTGNYALNKMISGDFNRGVPLGAVTVFAGESGSGKSYIVSGNIVRDALAQDVMVIVIDPEDALKQRWMRGLGVDVNHPNLHKEVLSTVDQIAECIQNVTSEYIEAYKTTPREQQQKLLFVIDSLGVVQTPAEVEQFERSELKGDKGIKAKTLKMLVANCIRLFAGYEIGLVATNHTYKSQDMYNPDDVISGGSGFIYAASIILSMNKKKLKEDEHGNKTTDVSGIRAKLKCVKTRYAKPFEEVEVHIPYDKGMNRYSGLFDMFEKTVFTKEGNRYKYVSADGTEHKLFRKNMTDAFFDMVMREYKDDRNPEPIERTEEATEETENVE